MQVRGGSSLIRRAGLRYWRASLGIVLGAGQGCLVGSRLSHNGTTAIFKPPVCHVDNAASVQVHQVVFQNLLAGHSVSQAMSNHCVTVPADLTLQQLVDEHVLGSGRRRFFVTRGADAVGMMTLHCIKEIPRPDRANTTTAQVMLPLDKLKRISPATELWAALQLMDRDAVNQLPVMTDITVAGMLSREDVVTYLRTSSGSGRLENSTERSRMRRGAFDRR